MNEPNTIPSEVLIQIVDKYDQANEAAEVIRAIQRTPEPITDVKPPTNWPEAFRCVFDSLAWFGGIVAIIWIFNRH